MVGVFVSGTGVEVTGIGVSAGLRHAERAVRIKIGKIKTTVLFFMLFLDSSFILQ
jgi:hypothetical protein